MKIPASLWPLVARIGIGLSVAFGGAFLAYSDVSVMVSAIVGTGNSASEILAVNPNTVPVVLRKNTIQTFSAQVRDLDSPSVSYTVTAGTGSVSPINGTLTNTGELTTGQAYVYFTYFSPPGKAGSSNITLTLNDGTAVIVKNISIFVY
jgi:hypothetical protein